MNTLITVQDLAVVRGGRTLLSGIGFQLAAEQALHIAGCNGSGKTSLLETLCGLRVPEQGRVTLPEPFHWIGHRNALNPALSADENLRFWCRLNDLGNERIENALDRLHLRAQRHQSCRELSTGQRRRAALARLLVARRSLWLLDEPLAGLDASGVELFTGMLSSHLALGGAAVITSHQNLPALPGLRRLDL